MQLWCDNLLWLYMFCRGSYNPTKYVFLHWQVLKVAILAEKYANDYTWYVDTILHLIRIAGDHVSEEVGLLVDCICCVCWHLYTWSLCVWNGVVKRTLKQWSYSSEFLIPVSLSRLVQLLPKLFDILTVSWKETVGQKCCSVVINEVCRVNCHLILRGTNSTTF